MQVRIQEALAVKHVHSVRRADKLKVNYSVVNLQSGAQGSHSGTKKGTVTVTSNDGPKPSIRLDLGMPGH